MKAMKWILMSLAVCLSATAGTLRPFTSDGCTFSPDGLPRRPVLWRECCVAHDLRFWGGGSRTHRQDADQKLKSCVENKAGATIAKLFFTGVQLGSLSPWKFPAKKWGNAWYDLAGYRKLSEVEILSLVDEVEKLDLPEELRVQYISELKQRLTSSVSQKN